MKVTRTMVEGARHGEYDYYQRNGRIGTGRFIPTPDAVIRAMLEGALVDVPDPPAAPQTPGDQWKGSTPAAVSKPASAIVKARRPGR